MPSSHLILCRPGVTIMLVHAQLLQPCLTLCNPMDCSPPRSSVHGILHVRMLKWVAFSYSRGSSWLGDQNYIFCISCTGKQILFGSVGKESTCNARDEDLIPGLGRSPGVGHGNSLQYFCLDNPMDRGAWWATVHGAQRVTIRESIYFIFIMLQTLC